MLPRPKYCGQNWLEMCPTNNGRICPGCNKVIIDFTKKSWKEIEEKQKQNNNAICGMYSNKQLNYWGQEIPRNKLSRTFSIMAFLTAVVSTSVIGQENQAQKTLIRGTTTGISLDGRKDTLQSTSIWLKNTLQGTVSDNNGKYEIDVSNYMDTLENPTLVFSYAGFSSLELKLNSNQRGEIQYDVQLDESIDMPIVFYVRRPTFGERMNVKIKNWFKRKEKS